MQKPNILLITTDSQRWDTLNCMGSPFAVSPHLDNLAREGVLFEQAHTSAPACMPARCSLLTGLHTPVHGCLENGMDRHVHFPTLPDLLKEQGYHTIMVGKTHFSKVPDSFDVQHIVGEKMVNMPDAYSKHIAKHGYNRVSNYPNPIPEELFMEAFLVDKMIEELESWNSEQKSPFFAFCSLISPHEPVDPPGRWAKLYDNTVFPDINYNEGEIKDFPNQMRALLGFENYDPASPLPNNPVLQDLFEAHGAVYHEGIREQVDELRRLYYGLAAYCDDQIGRLTQYLDKAGLRENTLIIFSSDHGLQLFDHGFNDKHNFYDASWRVPLIMSMPGTLPMNETREFAIWNDIPVSILGAAGISTGSMQGFDLFTALRNGQASPRNCAVATLYQSAALTTKDWKLIYYLDDGEGVLFHRKTDPLEQNNVYDNPLFQKVRNDLVQALLTWRSELMDIHFYHNKAALFFEQMNSRGKDKIKAPVARRAANGILAKRGVDAEVKLIQRVEHLIHQLDQDA